MLIQAQVFTLIIGIFIKQGKDRKNCGKSQALNQHQDSVLLDLNHVFRPVGGQSSAGELSYDQGKNNLKGVNIKEHHKKQDSIQEDRVQSLQPIAARIDVMLIPNLDKQREADGKGRKALHGIDQLRESFRDLQGNHQQSNGKSKNSVGERFQARDLSRAPVEVFLSWNKFLGNHGALIVP